MGGLDRMIDRHAKKGTATGDPDADALLREDGNALLIGALLDQQIQAEMAFTGPSKLKDRLGHLDMEMIANMDPDDFKEIFSESPAVHRFTNMMADRTQILAKEIVEEYDGDAARIWNDGAELTTIQTRVQTLPGFGKAKVKTLLHALDFFGHRSFDVVD